MAHHRDQTYSESHNARVYTVSENGALPATPDGIGRFYYDDTASPEVLYIAKPDLTGWYTGITIGGLSGAALNDLTNVSVPTPVNGQVLTYNTVSGNWEATAPASTVTAIDDLSDVDATAPTNNDILQYNTISGNWEAGAQSFGALNDLSDATITSPSNGEVLSYNGSAWVNGSLALNDLSNVIASGAVSGSRLEYNGTNWVIANNPNANLADLNNVTNTGLASGDYLEYNGSAWVNTPLTSTNVGYTPATPANWNVAPTEAGGGLDELASRTKTIENNNDINDLGDVVITAPANGEVLTYESSSGNWINSAGGGGGGGALNDLTDVTITSPSNGEVLSYNGSAWVNAASGGGGGGGYTPADSSDWSTAPTTVGGGLDTLASDTKSFYGLFIRTASSVHTDNGILQTITPTGGEQVFNNNGVWSSFDPDWLKAPEPGFYTWTISWKLDWSAYSPIDGPVVVVADYWDGATSTRIAETENYYSGAYPIMSGVLVAEYYRGVGGSDMFVQFKISSDVGDNADLTFSISWKRTTY